MALSATALRPALAAQTFLVETITGRGKRIERLRARTSRVTVCNVCFQRTRVHLNGCSFVTQGELSIACVTYPVTIKVFLTRIENVRTIVLRVADAVVIRICFKNDQLRHHPQSCVVKDMTVE